MKQVAKRVINLHQQPTTPMQSLPNVTLESVLLQVMQLLQQTQQQALSANESKQSGEIEQAESQTMDVKEAAVFMRVSEWTIRDMVRTKEIPHFRVRSRIFFKRRELDKWKISQQQQEVRT